MDLSVFFSRLLSGLLPWFLLLFLVAALVALLRRPSVKGAIGEWMVRLSVRLWLSGDVYRRFHDVTLTTPDGTTQIDLLLLSPYGAFVFEVKNMEGRIMGRGHEARWTQCVRGRNYTFQNPLRQNHKHVKAVEAALGLPPEAIHSVIVFIGGASLKEGMPPEVTRWAGFVDYVETFTTPILSEERVQAAITDLAAARRPVSRQTHREHVARLHARTDPGAVRHCPRCGGLLVLRTARRGSRAGGQFWGCSAYPKCRLVQPL